MRITSKLRVLIAEDDYLVSEMIEGLLQEMGHAVVGKAANGLEAVEMTCTRRPDVVLMDVKMPQLDGIQATRRIYDRCPTPVVIVSAYETPALIARASQAGAGDYLIKPPNARQLERALSITVARFNDMMALRRLNADLDAYAQTVAQNLKAPLDLILQSADFLFTTYDTVSSQELEGRAKHIAHNARQMEEIIENLLSIAQNRGTEENNPDTPNDVP